MNVAYGIKTDAEPKTGLKRFGDYLIIEGSTRPAPEYWKEWLTLPEPSNVNLLDGIKGQRVWVVV